VRISNDDAYIVGVWKNPAGATPNDWTQNARRGSPDIDHLASICR
jgi:hypothetical protein